MTLKLTRRLATALLCTLSLCTSSQQRSALKQRGQGNELKKDVIFLNQGSTWLSGPAHGVIRAWNFEAYPGTAARTRFQFLKGPVLEILAKKETDEVLPSGKLIVVNNNAVEKIRMANTYDFILQLNIGWAFFKNNVMK